MSKNECVICKRIDAKYVFEMSHKIFSGEHAHKIASESVQIINKVDALHRMFFMCRSKHVLLAGLFHALAKKYGLKATGYTIAAAFPSSLQSANPQIQPTVVHKMSRLWQQTFPHFFRSEPQ
jgi:hypothetical protein